MLIRWRACSSVISVRPSRFKFSTLERNSAYVWLIVVRPLRYKDLLELNLEAYSSVNEVRLCNFKDRFARPRIKACSFVIVPVLRNSLRISSGVSLQPNTNKKNSNKSLKIYHHYLPMVSRDTTRISFKGTEPKT